MQKSKGVANRYKDCPQKSIGKGLQISPTQTDSLFISSSDYVLVS